MFAGLTVKISIQILRCVIRVFVLPCEREDCYHCSDISIKGRGLGHLLLRLVGESHIFSGST